MLTPVRARFAIGLNLVRVSSALYNNASLFHVGYVKSATTYLQKNVFCANDLGMGLAAGEEHRAFLIQRFRNGNPYAFDKAKVRSEMIQAEADLRAQGLVPVWSEETLLGDPDMSDYCGAVTCERLCSLELPMKVLITIREQRDFAYSSYSEYLKVDRHSLTEYIGTGTERQGYSPILEPHFLCYSDAVETWQNAVGAENVLVLPIELLRTAPTEYLQTLSEFVGVPAPKSVPDARSNVALGATASAAARRLNGLYVRSRLGRPASRSERVARKAVRWVNRLAPSALDRAISRRWVAQIAERYDGVFTEDNARLEALTGLELGRFGYQSGNF